MTNRNSAQKPPKLMKLIQGTEPGAGVMVEATCPWPEALDMLLNALVQVRIEEKKERQKVVVEATPEDTKKLVKLN